MNLSEQQQNSSNQQQQEEGEQNQQPKTQDCFGGAITIQLPSYFVSVSEIRQTPDNQEVFFHNQSGAAVIVELLERVTTAKDSEAVAFHFNEIASSNKATSSEIIQISDAKEETEDISSPSQQNQQNQNATTTTTTTTTTTAASSSFSSSSSTTQGTKMTSYRQMLFGKQSAAKFSETGKENEVAVFIGLRRLPPPISTDILVSVSYAIKVDSESSDNKDWEIKFNPEQIQQLGTSAFESLTICDYSLFVPDDE